MEKFLWKQSDKISKDSVTVHIITGHRIQSKI